MVGNVVVASDVLIGRRILQKTNEPFDSVALLSRMIVVSTIIVVLTSHDALQNCSPCFDNHQEPISLVFHMELVRAEKVLHQPQIQGGDDAPPRCVAKITVGVRE